MQKTVLVETIKLYEWQKKTPKLILEKYGQYLIQCVVHLHLHHSLRISLVL